MLSSENIIRQAKSLQNTATYINNNNSAEGVEKSIGDPLAKHLQGIGFYLLNGKH